MTFNDAVSLRKQTLNELTAAVGPDVELVSRAVLATVQNEHTVFFMGNGGSAADAQHLAAELVGRFVRERRALPAMALTADSVTLTAVSNDYGFHTVFERQVFAHVRSGDIVFGLSTSGRSPNVLLGLRAARERSAITVGLTGHSGGDMASACDFLIRVPSDSTVIIQELHMLIGHYICQLVDDLE